jgi:hypothetical protein
MSYADLTLDSKRPRDERDKRDESDSVRDEGDY